MLTGHADLDSMAVYKFLNKPWDDAVIRDKVDEAFGYYEARNGRAGNNEL